MLTDCVLAGHITSEVPAKSEEPTTSNEDGDDDHRDEHGVLGSQSEYHSWLSINRRLLYLCRAKCTKTGVTRGAIDHHSYRQQIGRSRIEQAKDMDSLRSSRKHE